MPKNDIIVSQAYPPKYLFRFLYRLVAVGISAMLKLLPFFQNKKNLKVPTYTANMSNSFETANAAIKSNKIVFQ